MEKVNIDLTPNFFFESSDGSGNKVPVCAVFFRGTLGMTNDSAISTVINKMLLNESLLPFPDQRGRKVPPTKMATSISKLVIDHNLSFNPSITYYRRKMPRTACKSLRNLTSKGCMMILYPKILVMCL